jgi:hypothetical protein
MPVRILLGRPSIVLLPAKLAGQHAQAIGDRATIAGEVGEGFASYDNL